MGGSKKGELETVNFSNNWFFLKGRIQKRIVRNSEFFYILVFPRRADPTKDR